MHITGLHEIPHSSTPGEIISAFHGSGTVLIRDLHLALSGFESLSCQLCDKFHPIGSRYFLGQTGDDGLTTKVPANKQAILGHLEGHYSPYPGLPDVCLFYCMEAPDPGGAGTFLIDGTALIEKLPRELVDRFRLQGIIYEMYWEPERWRASFSVSSTQELLQLLETVENIEFSLDNNGVLHLRYKSTAIETTDDGKPAFANGILAHLHDIPPHPVYNNSNTFHKQGLQVYFGNGEPLSDDVIIQLIDSCDELSHVHKWKSGDLLLFNNRRYMHGRGISLSATNREIYTRFGWMRKP